jgi:hypothetical protein
MKIKNYIKLENISKTYGNTEKQEVILSIENLVIPLDGIVAKSLNKLNTN